MITLFTAMRPTRTPGTSLRQSTPYTRPYAIHHHSLDPRRSPPPPPLPRARDGRSALGDGRRELVEVNDAIAISVHAAYDALTFNEGHLLARSEFECEAELGRIEEAVA